MSRLAALLRGVNVGGKHVLPMAELRALLEQLGCRDVETLLQSGNAVFAADARAARGLGERLERALVRRFGFEVPVVLRSAADLARVLARNPFLADGAPEDALHVAFLRERPARARAAALDPGRSPGDAFALVGSELYLHLPNGVARTRLTSAWLDASLGTVATVRNWRTATKLARLAAGEA